MCLRSNDGDRDGDGVTLSGIIRPVSLDYVCLSYTWGDPSEQRRISLNGRPFRVRVNLYVALEHIQTHLGDRILPIWINVICIKPERRTREE